MKDRMKQGSEGNKILKENIWICLQRMNKKLPIGAEVWKGGGKKEKGIQYRGQHRKKISRCINDWFAWRLGIVWYIGRTVWKKPGTGIFQVTFCS